MLMMLLQTSPSILEQLGGRAALIQKELERREKVQQMNVRLSFSVLTFVTSFSKYFRSRWILIQPVLFELECIKKNQSAGHVNRTKL